uniref:Secreted protein n=1 Tax=Steinernema glaseri TaxID=37863 RepID=A0A1I7Y7W5_9BILA
MCRRCLLVAMPCIDRRYEDFITSKSKVFKYVQRAKTLAAHYLLLFHTERRQSPAGTIGGAIADSCLPY